MSDLSLAHLLVVEDDPSIAAGLVRGLKQAGFAVQLATDGDQAALLVEKDPPALVVLDLNLPGRDGFSLLESWQTRQSFPVIVLTARAGLEERVRSFQLGAADYVAKPFWLEELLARIKTRLRLKEMAPARGVRWADLHLDLDARTVTREGQGGLELTAAEYNLLAYLAERPGRAVSRDQLGQHALPLLGERNDRTIDSHIARVRKKLGPGGEAIRAVWGIGYRFEPGYSPSGRSEPGGGV